MLKVEDLARMWMNDRFLVQVMREWFWGKIWNSLMDGMIAFVGFGYCVLTKTFPSFMILSVFKWWFSERPI